MPEPEEETFDTDGAVSYLCLRFPDLGRDPKKLKDTFYHQVSRGRVPHERTPHNSGVRYSFKKSDLDRVRFRKAQQSSKKVRKTQRVGPEHWGLEGIDNEFWENFEPGPIHDASELERLRKIFGDLVDGVGLRSLLLDLFGVDYSPGAIKSRRYRGTIFYVGYSGARRRTYWYPVAQIYVLNWQPDSTKGSPKKSQHISVDEFRVAIPSSVAPKLEEAQGLR